MKQYKILEDYVENEQLNIEQVIKDYSGYVYTAIINISENLSDEDIEEILSDVFFIFYIFNYFILQFFITHNLFSFHLKIYIFFYLLSNSMQS